MTVSLWSLLCNVSYGYTTLEVDVVTNSRNKRQATIHSQYWEPSSCITSPVVFSTSTCVLSTAGWGGAKTRCINNGNYISKWQFRVSYTHALWIFLTFIMQEICKPFQESKQIGNESHLKFFIYFLFEHVSCNLSSTDFLKMLLSGSME